MGEQECREMVGGGSKIWHISDRKIFYVKCAFTYSEQKGYMILFIGPSRLIIRRGM